MARILWIDDYAGKGTDRRMGFDALICFVEQNGHRVEIASTSALTEKALQNIDSYDLVILDIIMDPLPSSSQSGHQYGGIDVLERFSRAHTTVPIVILSVMRPMKIREEAARRGLDLSDVGVKETRRKGSLTPTELAAIVQQHLADKANSAAGE